MLIILSPSKTMDFSPIKHSLSPTQPLFMQKAAKLVSLVRQMDTEDIRQLMSVSGTLASQTKARYAEWIPEHNEQNAKPAILCFSGDVYDGLAASDFYAEDFDYAQKHLIILSGLYGLLRPMDLMMPYRMELGYKWETELFSNLYEYWKDSVNDAFQNLLRKSGSNIVINLASQEYFKIIDINNKNIQLITPSFYELKNGSMQMVSLFAKRARGMMVRFLIKNKIHNPLLMREFNDGHYAFIPDSGDEYNLIFAR